MIANAKQRTELLNRVEIKPAKVVAGGGSVVTESTSGETGFEGVTVVVKRVQPQGGKRLSEINRRLRGASLSFARAAGLTASE